MKLLDIIGILSIIIAGILTAQILPSINLLPVLNHSLTGVVVGTIVAAFAGAYGAQLIVEKTKYQELLLLEIRNVNAAIMLAFSICNSAIVLKKTHVSSLWIDYNDNHTKVVEHIQLTNEGKLKEPTLVEVEMNLKNLQHLLLPTDMLQNIIIDKISSPARILNLAATLHQVHHSLNGSIKIRNDLIEDFKAHPFKKNQNFLEKNAFYFGFPNERGGVDTSYPDSVKSIYDLCDDLIFMSHLLAKDLERYGKKISAGLKQNIKIANIDFSSVYKLFPPEENYKDWLLGFKNEA